METVGRNVSLAVLILPLDSFALRRYGDAAS
jgi:hypothetical protein